MSSWKKAAKAHQKNHRERRQPESRAHLGFLEKKKDYKQRADDFNKKKKALTLLKRRALNKNPDEFYFHMINSKTEDGVHFEMEKEDEHTPEQLLLMNTQDLRYVTMKRTMEMKKIESLQAQLHMLDAANDTQNQHVFFVDSKDEVKNFDVAARLDTHPSLLGRRINRLKMDDLKTMKLDLDEESIKNVTNQRKKMYQKLAKRIEREKELGIIQQKLEIRRHLIASKHMLPKKVKNATKKSPAIYKWHLERKK